MISTQVTSLSQSLANDAAANPRAPKPVRVTFAPKRNVRYCSRYRFNVHHGESFDVVLQGAGSYEEDVLPRHVRVAEILERPDRGFRVFEGHQHCIGVPNPVRRCLAARTRRDAF